MRRQGGAPFRTGGTGSPGSFVPVVLVIALAPWPGGWCWRTGTLPSGGCRRCQVLISPGPSCNGWPSPRRSWWPRDGRPGGDLVKGAAPPTSGRGDGGRGWLLGQDRDVSREGARPCDGSREDRVAALSRRCWRVGEPPDRRKGGPVGRPGALEMPPSSGWVASLEAVSEHPLGEAMLARAREEAAGV